MNGHKFEYESLSLQVESFFKPSKQCLLIRYNPRLTYDIQQDLKKLRNSVVQVIRDPSVFADIQVMMADNTLVQYWSNFIPNTTLGQIENDLFTRLLIGLNNYLTLVWKNRFLPPYSIVCFHEFPML